MPTYAPNIASIPSFPIQNKRDDVTYTSLTTFLATSSAFSLDSRDGEEVTAAVEALGAEELLYDRDMLMPAGSSSSLLEAPSLTLLALGMGLAPVAVEM